MANSISSGGVDVSVTWPIFATFVSANHSKPFGPEAIPFGPEFAVGVSGCGVGIVPFVVSSPMRLELYCVNQRFPSLPTVMPAGPFCAGGVGIAYWLVTLGVYGTGVGVPVVTGVPFPQAARSPAASIAPAATCTVRNKTVLPMKRWIRPLLAHGDRPPSPGVQKPCR
jgi:hypothetical protein